MFNLFNSLIKTQGQPRISLLGSNPNSPKKKEKVSKSIVREQVREKKTNMRQEIQEIDAQIEINEAREKLRTEEQERLNKFKVEFDDDPEFAIEAYAKDLSIEEAKTEYWRRWEEQKAKAAEPIITEDPSGKNQADFIEAGKALAAAEGIKLGQALKQVCKEQPALYKAYKQRCYGQN